MDEEDIVSIAFAAFCRAAKKGQYQQVANRNELCGLLVVITLRKAGQRVQMAPAATREIGQILSQQDRD